MLRAMDNRAFPKGQVSVQGAEGKTCSDCLPQVDSEESTVGHADGSQAGRGSMFWADLILTMTTCSDLTSGKAFRGSTPAGRAFPSILFLSSFTANHRPSSTAINHFLLVEEESESQKWERSREALKQTAAFNQQSNDTDAEITFCVLHSVSISLSHYPLPAASTNPPRTQPLRAWSTITKTLR